MPKDMNFKVQGVAATVRSRKPSSLGNSMTPGCLHFTRLFWYGAAIFIACCHISPIHLGCLCSCLASMWDDGSVLWTSLYGGLVHGSKVWRRLCWAWGECAPMATCEYSTVDGDTGLRQVHGRVRVKGGGVFLQVC